MEFDGHGKQYSLAKFFCNVSYDVNDESSSYKTNGGKIAEVPLSLDLYVAAMISSCPEIIKVPGSEEYPYGQVKTGKNDGSS